MSANRPIRCVAARRASRGFTLVELIIAVVVAAILLSLALPSFLDSIRKGRRSEAMTGITAVQQAQERFRSSNASYASALTSLGVAGTTQPGGYYTLSLSNASATGYTITADGSGGSQANDGNCAKLSVRMAAGNLTYASCKACSTFTYAVSDPCFAR